MLKNIWSNNSNEGYFRRKFVLDEMPKTAFARIFVDTGYEFFINGRFVAAVDEWCNTRDYDVRLFLNEGENVIAVRAINHGGHRGFAFELALDGKSYLTSNAQWKMSNTEKWGWILKDYDDSAWDDARELNLIYFGEPQWWTLPGSEPGRIIPTLDCSQFFNGNIPKTCASPYWNAKMPAHTVSEGVKNLLGEDYIKHIEEEHLPKIHLYDKVIENTGALMDEGILIDDTQRYTGQSFIVDFGVQTIGYFRLKLKSEASASFRLYYGETLDEAAYEISRDACQNRMLREEYRVFAGEQEFESRMRVSFRFVRVEFFDCAEPVMASDFSVRTTLYPVNRRGYFKCSDQDYNKLWLMGERTVHYCMQEYYIDAPKRDRFLWTGDARLEALANYYMFADTQLLEFSWDELVRMQYPNGGIPSSLGEGCSMLWDYVVWYIIAYHDYYMFTGKSEFVLKNLDSIYKAMEYMISCTNDRGVISVPENPVGLWMIELNSYVGEDTYLNKIYLRSLECAAAIAALAGDEKAKERYSALYESAKPEVEKLLEGDRFFEEMNNRWDTQIQYELAETELFSGRIDAMIDRINRKWLTMTRNGSDCLYEGAVVGPQRVDEHHTTEPNYVSSCHGWTAAANILLPMGIAGIRPIEPGFKTVEIRPQTNVFESFACAVPTPYGDIAVRCKDGKFDFCLPDGVVAKILIGGRELTETGCGQVDLAG